MSRFGWNVKAALRKVFTSTWSLVLLTSAAATPLYAVETGSLKVGAAKVDITPKDFAGFWMVWAQPFDGVHDPIYARAVVVGNGISTVAIVSTDLVEFGDSMALRQRIERELSIPADHIIISASHDHNAPRGGPITPGSSSAQGRPYSPPAYIKFVDDSIVDAVREAKAGSQTARVGVGLGHADVNVNRNGYNGHGWGGADPEGPSDKSVWVVKFESISGDPIALLINYAVHSTVTGPQNTKVTGDLAGAAERFVEKHYQGKAVALWTMGPAGDQNPKYDLSSGAIGAGGPKNKDDSVYDAMDAMGLIVGSEVVLTADRIRQETSAVRIKADESVFSCDTVPQRSSPPPSPADSTPRPNGPMFPPNASFHENIPYPSSMKIHLNLIELNQIAITGVSGEVFTKIYWHLKKESPLAETILVTMSNDRIGYIGDDASYDGPFRNPSIVRGCAENGIVNGLVKMMSDSQ